MWERWERFYNIKIARWRAKAYANWRLLAISRKISFNSNNIARLPGYLGKSLFFLLLFFTIFYMQLCTLSCALSSPAILHSHSYNILVFTLLKTPPFKYLSCLDSWRKCISSGQVGERRGYRWGRKQYRSPIWIKMCPKAAHGTLLPNLSDLCTLPAKGNKNKY